MICLLCLYIINISISKLFFVLNKTKMKFIVKILKKKITIISIVKNLIIYIDEFDVFNNSNSDVNKHEIKKINFCNDVASFHR